MWIFTTYGFFSFTQSTHTPGFIQIRARDDRDLDDLKKRHKLKGKVIETDNSDYRWRILVKPDTAAKIVAAEVEAIDYANFKNATTDRQHARPLMAVWSSMMTVQTARERELGRHRPRPGTGTVRASNGHGWTGGYLPLFDRFEPEDDQADDDLADAPEFKTRRRRAQGYGARDTDDADIPF